jgi:hypothetical protein
LGPRKIAGRKSDSEQRGILSPEEVQKAKKQAWLKTIACSRHPATFDFTTRDSGGVYPADAANPE